MSDQQPKIKVIVIAAISLCAVLTTGVTAMRLLGSDAVVPPVWWIMLALIAVTGLVGAMWAWRSLAAAAGNKQLRRVSFDDANNTEAQAPRPTWTEEPVNARAAD